MTNFEKIKAMSVEEMAKLLRTHLICDYCIHYYEKSCGGFGCLNGIIKWLESEVEE